MTEIRVWWRRAHRHTRWTWRDYARHFGVVATLTFTIAFPLIAITALGA